VVLEDHQQLRKVEACQQEAEHRAGAEEQEQAGDQDHPQYQDLHWEAEEDSWAELVEGPALELEQCVAEK